MKKYKHIRVIRSFALLSLLAGLIIAGLKIEKKYTISFSEDSGFYSAPFYLEIGGGWRTYNILYSGFK